MNLNALDRQLPSAGRAATAPAMFIGHGSPMNIIRDNTFTRKLRDLGSREPTPAVVLVVSAHWLTRGETRVSVNPAPKTIYDFGGFPRDLYEVSYLAPGSPDRAREVVANVKSVQVHEDHEMGLDHGAWSILRHLWPEAKVPVFQLSMDFSRPPSFHYELGKELRSLRERGLMILGSGNIVHNLRTLDWQHEEGPPFDWAAEFDDWSKTQLETRNHAALQDYLHQGPAARMAVPTNDHYLPMLYTLGVQGKDEQVRFTHESFQHGSISMRCFELV